MKVMITGKNGQLAADLIRVLKSDHEIYGFNRREMDITDFASVQKTVEKVRPDLIIHAAAYTKVDQAEQDRDTAFLVNAYGTRNMVVAAQQIDAKTVYLSTDYVFAGTADAPYCEFDAVGPQSVYGKSKLAGEEMVKSISNKFYIIRTSWLYGQHGDNFVKTMLRLGEEREELFVVNDQIGSPTYTMDLAFFIQELMLTDKYGIYHASNSGRCSWYEFAKAIFEEAGLPVRVHPVATKEFPRPAPRPAFSVLDHLSIRLSGFSAFRHWREALKEFMGSYVASE